MSSKFTVFLAGDSTVTDQPKDKYPYSGWGQLLPTLFTSDIAIDNHAISARSSKSFVDEGRLDKILESIQPNDYLLIQFGHNDQKEEVERRTEPYTTYKQYLQMYIDGARHKGAIPILITPPHRRFFKEDGTLEDRHGEYVPAMKQLAAEQGVPLIDLAQKSKQLFEQLGPEGSKKIFMMLEPGEFENYPNGKIDNTHFQEYGAIRLAELVTEGLKELEIKPLIDYVKEGVQQI